MFIWYFITGGFRNSHGIYTQVPADIYLINILLMIFIFLKNDTSKLIQNVYIETKNFTGTFSSSLIIIFESLVLISIVCLLFSIQFKITLITLLIFFFIMIFIS